jgi:2-polyprenyl-3-methyl-5-hydroxy-6-metoxy-1,4-benzoquinol methylase
LIRHKWPSCPHPERYREGTAEDFDFDVKFDVILVADLIEHLSNLGSFLDSCARNLKANGRIVITTPNCFNLFNIASKITRTEPIMNKDETCYFNHRALRQLLGKHGWKVSEASYLYSLGVEYRESYKKKVLNVIYYLLSKFTPKFVETVVVVAKRA